MPEPVNARLRRLWLNNHLWIGLGVVVLRVSTSLSGALLIRHDQRDDLRGHRVADLAAQAAQDHQSPQVDAAE